MSALEKTIDAMVAAFKYLGAAALAAMMLVTCVDVVCRAVDRPLWGLVEGVSLLATLMLGLSLPVTQRERGHVALDMLVRRLPERAAALVDGLGHLACLAFFAVVAWQSWLYASQLQDNGELSMSLGLPLHFILRLIALAFAGLALTLAADLAASVRRVVRP